MQNWDVRIKNLKRDIQNAREKFVVPYLDVQPKTTSKPVETKSLDQPVEESLQNEVLTSENKIYENKDPLSSMSLLNTNENVTTEDTKVGLTEEISNKLDTALVSEALATEEAPTVDVAEALATEEAPTVDVSEALATEEAPTVDVAEALATEEAPTVDVAEALATEDVLMPNSDENIVKKSELQLLEERDENDLSEEEEDRMYELRRLRAQKEMNKEEHKEVEDELKKADEEIAHLKSQLKPKPKKLPKGYIA